MDVEIVHGDLTEVRSLQRTLVPDIVGLAQHEPASEPTFLRAIANKASRLKRPPCITEVSTSEEPGAGKLHAGVCAGGAG